LRCAATERPSSYGVVSTPNVSQYSIRKIEWRDADLPRENQFAPDGWRRDPDGSPSGFLPNLGRASPARPFLLRPRISGISKI
jgi:hypothetical protein